MRHDDKQKDLNVVKKNWINKIGFQHRGLINNVLAKRFMNPGGPPVCKLHFFWAERGLINIAGVINPNLTIYILYIYIYYIYIHIYITYITYSIFYP